MFWASSKRLIYFQFVGNKGKERKQNMPDFPKNEHFFPPDMHTRAHQGVRDISFSENLACFEICPLALLPTNLQPVSKGYEMKHWMKQWL